MGSQIHAMNDRTRTYWTRTMERYFIDLMLEQMHRGNRIGHTFSKQAWTDMLTVFNAKFGSQYDKDVLKSRYTNLWKQFNDVKNLLAENGFSWDDSRHMVVADDYVWDAYIKAHPDARSYKTKTVLNFNDLCLIYGYTTADGRYSRSSHDLDFDDEVQGLNMGDFGSLSSTNNERSRTEWNADMDQYFIELMLDQVGRGNKVDNTFNKQAWKDMLDLFNAKFGPQHGKRVLRHRYKKLWKYYSDVTVILKQKGFSWDETQLMVTADNDVWDAYIKIFQFSGDGKGCVNPASDRTRTFCTPPMGRYFIDLLLDQVHRGNKLGQAFLTQAWVDMVTSFNVKFGSHYDKDVLKNRYKHLRRLYNDLKILLEQGGFSWDEARDMVIAEDNVWDAYIKSHTDARTYRVKTVSSYHKLSVIFGKEICDGRYNRLAQNVGTNGDITVLMTGYAPMDRFFIDLLEQVHEGNKIDRAFNEEAWVHMVESFNEKFGVQLDKNMLENQYMCLMKQYDDISDLLNHSGFVWDEAKQMVVANNDVWEVYIKMGVLDGIPSGQVLGVESNHGASEVILDRACGNLQTPGGDIHLSDQQRKRSTATPDLERASKAQKTDQEMQKMLSSMAGAVTRLASQ
ncbi:hypothetical protein REPUB_Repub03eG0009500 [Reevesia pubescens]